MYVITIENCSSCGKRHLGVVTYIQPVPTYIDNVPYYVTGTCPTTGQTLYIQRENAIQKGGKHAVPRRNV